MRKSSSAATPEASAVPSTPLREAVVRGQRITGLGSIHFARLLGNISASTWKHWMGGQSPTPEYVLCSVHPPRTLICNFRRRSGH
jgi:hypothetical protein